MNTIDWPPQIGTWYLRWDKNEIFQVTGHDEKSQRIAVQTYAGDVGEIDKPTWDSLSVGLADPPEDWTGPIETVDVVNFDSSSGDPVSEDVAEPRPQLDQPP
jgi:hypothetical protein